MSAPRRQPILYLCEFEKISGQQLHLRATLTAWHLLRLFSAYKNNHSFPPLLFYQLT